MKNADMPAMPLTGDAYKDINGSSLVPGRYEDGMGLTKREHFAALVMQGLSTREGYSSPAMVALDAVAAADALLAELENPNDN